jgi:hypothetical protein
LTFTEVWAKHGFEDRRSAREYVGSHWDPAELEIQETITTDTERVELESTRSQKSLWIEDKTFVVLARGCWVARVKQRRCHLV